VSRRYLNIVELIQLSNAVTNATDDLTDAQVERVVQWANTVRAESALLERVLAGDVAITLPNDGNREMRFGLTQKGRDRAQETVKTIFADFKKTLAEQRERIAARTKPAETKPTNGTSTDLTNYMRELLDGLFGKQTPETIKADAERNAKKGGAS